MRKIYKSILLVLFLITLLSCEKEKSDIANLKILFLNRSDNDPSDYFIYKMKLDGTQPEKATDITFDMFEIFVSKEFNKVATFRECYSNDTCTHNCEFFILDLTRNTSKIIAKSNDRFHYADWSKIKPKITYTKKIDTIPYNDVIFIYDINEDKEYRLTESGNCWRPKFSPDGMKIAYYMDRNLYIMDSDGTNQKLIVQDIFLGYNWSPKGDEIAYCSNDEKGSPQIFVININNGIKEQLTDSYIENPEAGKWKIITDGDTINIDPDYFGNYEPVWTPNGEKIVYVSKIHEGLLEIYIMDNDGSNKKRLTKTEGENTDPQVSPDGKQILFLSSRSYIYSEEIYIMDIDGSNQINLSGGRMFDQYPSFIDNN